MANACKSEGAAGAPVFGVLFDGIVVFTGSSLVNAESPWELKARIL